MYRIVRNNITYSVSNTEYDSEIGSGLAGTSNATFEIDGIISDEKLIEDLGSYHQICNMIGGSLESLDQLEDDLQIYNNDGKTTICTNYNVDLFILIVHYINNELREYKVECDYTGLLFWLFHDLKHAKSDVNGNELYTNQYRELTAHTSALNALNRLYYHNRISIHKDTIFPSKYYFVDLVKMFVDRFGNTLEKDLLHLFSIKKEYYEEYEINSY